MTLDYIWHSKARESVRQVLVENNIQVDWITDINISRDDLNSISYTVKFLDGTIVKVFDDGNVIGISNGKKYK